MNGTNSLNRMAWITGFLALFTGIWTDAGYGQQSLDHETAIAVFTSGGGAAGSGNFHTAIAVVGDPLAGVQSSVFFRNDTGYMNIYQRRAAEPPTTVEEPELQDSTPRAFALKQNHPNPFNPATTIRFELAEQSVVTLNIYDVLGREVATLISGETYQAGGHSIRWDGRNRTGEPAASGVYFYRIQAGRYAETRKMVLMR